MNTKLTILLFTLIFGNVFAQQDEAQITLETKTGKIRGTLLSPASAGPFPVVLLISGSGPTDRNGNNPMMVNNALKMVAEKLAENDIASVRYDKRGVGESKDAGLEESELRFEHYIEDAEAWITLLNKDTRFSEIIIAGHSEGSLIGMIAAQREEVSKFISLAGSGVPAAAAIKEQLKAQPPMVKDPSMPILEKLETGQTTDSVPQILYPLFRPGVQSYLISWFKYDPREEISKLNIPVLIVQGTTDIQINVADAMKLSEASKNGEIQIMDGMNHILKPAEADRTKNIQTYANPELQLQEGLIETIVNFIHKN